VYGSVESCATGLHTEVATLSSTLSSVDSVGLSLYRYTSLYLGVV